MLSEVESICDDLAIISRGRLLRQGSFAALASQAGGFEITASGLRPPVSEEIAQTGARVEAQADGNVIIRAADEQAQQRVLAILVQAGCHVLSTKRRTATLEELFFETLGEDPRA